MTSPAGVEHLEKNLWQIRDKYGIDFCVVNGENASFICGISKEQAELLLRCGADCITGGNHTMQNFGAQTYLDEEAAIIRPINYGVGAPGRGCTVIDTGKARVLVVNAMGNHGIEPCLDSPFSYIDKALSQNAGKYDLAILDIHAEATGEKLAIAFNYDGKFAAIFGTHTHVPTADTQILPKGTGYVTDLGMCGESGGILGMEIGSVIYKIRHHMPGRFRAASGACEADGVIFELDESYRATSVTRIKF